MLPSLNSTIVADSLLLLTDEYKGRPNIEGILNAATAELQEVEDMFWDVINTSILSNATVGDKLDQYGALLNLPRSSISNQGDSDYRVALSVQLLVYRSTGRMEDILLILRTLRDAYGIVSQYTELYPAAFMVETVSDTGTLNQNYLLALNLARLAGVNLYYQYHIHPLVNTFTLDDVNNPTTDATIRSNTGLGDIQNLSVAPGGFLSSFEDLVTGIAGH